MLIMPFLNEQQLKELEQEGISGIDLCGNGVVIVPGLLAVFRGGGKNRFPSSALIKNVYRLNSSMVGRVFFSRPNYNTVQEIRDEINRRNILVSNWNKKPMNLSTVSKVLQTLEDDLIIERKGNIKILQPDKLLENLNKNFTLPKIKETIRLKMPLGNKNIKTLLQSISKELNLPIAATGKSSVNNYTVMQREGILSVYCPRPDILVNKLSGNRTDRFPNLELLETEDETVFFDTKRPDNFGWASPIQVYLELMAGDKRDQETAEQVKSIILKNI